MCNFVAMKAFGDFVRYNKELGINEYDITVYASIFADNIQLHLEYDDKLTTSISTHYVPL